MPQTDKGEWFVKLSGTEFGPFNAKTLKKMAEEGRIRADDEIRRGPSPWTPASKVKGLFDSSGLVIPALISPVSSDLKPARPLQSPIELETEEEPREKRSVVSRPLVWGAVAGAVLLSLLGLLLLIPLFTESSRKPKRKSSASQVRGPELKSRTLPNAKSTAGPLPKILRASYLDISDGSKSRGQKGCAFEITVELKNDSPNPWSGDLSYYTRTIKPGFKIPEFETVSPNVQVPGEIKPGETIKHRYIVPCVALNGNDSLLHQLPEHSILEVSMDGELWYPALHIQPKNETKADTNKADTNKADTNKADQPTAPQ